jgi:hypothetical protein
MKRYRSVFIFSGTPPYFFINFIKRSIISTIIYATISKNTKGDTNMKMQCTMYLPPKKKIEYGHIKVTNLGIDLARKNKFFALGFGALGAILTPAKDFHSIAWDEVASIEMKKFGVSKKACYVTLKDEKEYVFRLPKPEASIALLQEEFKKAKESKINRAFLD